MHGRESLRKNSNLIMYNFYKNILLALPIGLYGLVCGMGGTSIYDTMFNLQLYNVVYTAFPIMIYALYDQEAKQETLADSPFYYIEGRKGFLFNKLMFW